MDEDFATAMQSGARELADQANLTPVRLIRAQGDQRRRRRAAGGVGLLVVASAAVGIGIIHFGGSGQHGPAPATTSPGTSESSDAERTPTTAPSTVSNTPAISKTPNSVHTSTAQPPSSPDCTMAQLKITLGHGGVGMGHSALPLIFLNTGSTACRLHGYPEVKALDANGHLVAQAQQTPSGYMGGLADGSTLLPTVDLNPGQSASALVEGDDVNPTDGSACTAHSSLLVTPPNETHSVRLLTGGGGCSDLQVHPVVPGTTGRSG